ncbi:hypothetical protein PVK06_035214 [Gossypium arboreum]|uniref:Uncharacterized protein n=1 Tax=Gossypium arboreum TaxID=29729 RepID=A0ABR0NG90_GOSAR|nr:hypothetical protein PVK06_035214 [Gossypium arboreum]
MLGVEPQLSFPLPSMLTTGPVVDDIEPPPLRANPTIAQIRQHSDKRAKKQLINLKRDFGNLKMKEAEIVKQYVDMIMVVVNSIRLLKDQFGDSRVVEKVITTLLKRYK